MFAASATRRAQLPDEERLTGADLNILENETRASGRRGGWSRGDAWKNIGIANRRTYSTELMRKWKAVKQKSSHRAVKPGRYISKTEQPFHLYGFVYKSSHREAAGSAEGHGYTLDTNSLVVRQVFFQPAVLGFCVGNHLRLPGENPYQKCCCDCCQCSEHESDHIRPFFACQSDRCD